MKQRIKQYSRDTRIVPQPDSVDYETIDQIDKKFQQLTNEAQEEYIQFSRTPKSNLRRMAYKKSNTIKNSQAIPYLKPHLTETDEVDEQTKQEIARKKVLQTLEERKKAQYSHFFVENYFKNKPKKKSLEQVSHGSDMASLVQRHGDFLQNSLMSALIIETLRQMYGDQVPLYDHFGTAQKILQQFNISPVMLANLKTPEERQKYLIFHFEAKAKSLMNEWELKISQKDKRLEQLDREMQQTRQRNKKLNDDMFYWLVLKTKFQTLQKKLRELLMEKINEYENQVNILEGIKNNKIIHLQNMPNVTIQELVSRTDPHAKQKPVEEKTIYDDQEFTWNPYLEKKFMKERERAFKAYSSAINSSNMNQVAFMQIFDQLKIEDPIYLQRDLKLQKYIDGDWLTPQEMKFLANTSELLNSCVDKKYIQRVADQVSKKQLHNLETYLSEYIISNHRAMKAKIEQARSNWIQQQIIQRKLQIKQKTIDQQRKLIRLQNIKENEKKKKTLERICKKMEKQISIKDQVYRNFYCQIFVRKIIQRLELYRYIKQEEERKYMDESYYIQIEENKKRKERIQELSKPRVDRVEKKRKYHPSSKVSLLQYRKLTEQELETIEGKQFNSRQEVMKYKEKEFKLQINDQAKNKQENFIKFYSNGPQKGLRQDPIFDPKNSEPPQVSDKELQCIIRIQKAIRKFICKRKLQNYKDVYYARKYRFYYNRLQEMVQQEKKFFDVLRNIGVRLRTSTLQTRVKSEIVLKSDNTRLMQKTEETEQSTFFQSRQARLTTQSSVKQLLIKHERLLRYSKINQATNILKSGFLYTAEDVDVVDLDGNTALYYAAFHGNNSLVEFLLRHGANPNKLCKEDTPMHMAVRSQKNDIIFMMMNYGGDLDVLNRCNQTPLVYANQATLKYLGLQQGIVSIKETPELPVIQRIPPQEFGASNYTLWAIRPFQSQIALPIYKFEDASFTGESVVLDNDCFNQPLRRDIIHRVVRYETLLYQKILQPTITMAEAAASGRKIIPQKKTGQARQGHRQRPGRYKGVKVHGRKMRSMKIDMPRKVRLLGLKIALSAAVYENRVQVIDNEQLENGKTKVVLDKISALKDKQFPLLVVHGLQPNKEFAKGVKNLEKVNSCSCDRVNLLKLLRNKTIIFTKEGLEGITQFLKERTDNAFNKKVETGVFMEMKQQLEALKKGEKPKQVEEERVIYDPTKPLNLKFKVLREYLEDFEQLKKEGKLDQFLKDMPKTKRDGRINSVNSV